MDNSGHQTVKQQTQNYDLSQQNHSDISTLYQSGKDSFVPQKESHSSVRLLHLNHIHSKQFEMKTMWGWSIPYSTKFREPTTVLKVNYFFIFLVHSIYQKDVLFMIYLILKQSVSKDKLLRFCV